MKLINTIAILALLGSTEAARRHKKRTLKGHYKNLIELDTHEGVKSTNSLGFDQWDAKLTDFMDPKSYMTEVRNAVEDDDEDEQAAAKKKK